MRIRGCMNTIMRAELDAALTTKAMLNKFP
jgi:hypothetical protein